MALICCLYQPEKEKSFRIMKALADGLCSEASLRSVYEPLDDSSCVAFYGVRPAWKHLWEQCKREGRDWIYLDNSLFDSCRERYFRISRNRIQPTGLGESDGKRFDAMGVDIKSMRDGETVIVAAQSEEFMECVAEDPGWMERVIANLRGHYGTNRVILRRKGIGRPLVDDLMHAGLLATWSSAAAVTALLSGVKVMCSPECCATYAGDDRRRWASVLADNQWTIDELRAGRANRLVL